MISRLELILVATVLLVPPALRAKGSSDGGAKPGKEPVVLVIVGSSGTEPAAPIAAAQAARWPLLKGAIRVVTASDPGASIGDGLPERIIDLREPARSNDSLGTRIRRLRHRLHGNLLELGMVGTGPDLLVSKEERKGRISVGIYVGPGVGGSGPSSLETTLNNTPDRFVARYLGPDDVRGGALAQFDLVVFPGGSGGGQAEGLGEKGREIVRRFVSEGGGYVGICAGCYLACENFSWSLKILDAKTRSSKWRRGVKELELGLQSEAAGLLGIEAPTVTVKYANGPVMEAAGSPDIPDFTTLAVFNTETAENETPPGIQIGTPAILTGTFGKGRVVGISPHPEQTEGLKEVVPKLIEWATASGN